MDRWRDVIDLGARLRLFDAASASRALERLAEARPEEATPAAIAGWLGIAEPALEALRLLATCPDTPDAETLRLRTEGLAGLAAALEAPTTVRHDATPTLPPAAPASPVSPRPKVPKNLGPYELGEELGHGGMGIVFRARHVKLGSGCAVKVLIAGEHASPEAIARFQREAAAVARMGKHPHIVTVHDFGEEGSLSYYAMELVEGESLRRRLAERPIAPREAASLLEKVARALHFAHGHGVIHRDIKPDNIVVRMDGEPQVMDFGLAREVGSGAQISVTGQVMGTPAYMAPEQVRGDVSATDAWTDVYAVGAVLYEALTGIPPHGGQDLGAIFARVLSGDIVPPRRLRAEVPRDVETICMKCLELSPAKRYASAEALAEDLARFQRGEPVHARPVGRVERAVRRVRRHPLVSSLIAASVVFALGMGWKFLGPAWIAVPVSPSNARVLVNGRPLRASGLVWPAGDAVITVQADEYEMQTRTVSLTPGRHLTLDPFHLRLDHGYLTVDSDPTGAQVLVDDRPLSHAAPVERAPVSNGTHRLTLRLADHVDDTRVISITSGEALPVGNLKLKHEEGTLALTGNPAGMSVSVRKEPANPAKGHEHEGPEVMRLSPPVTVPLDTGVYWLVGQLKDHFERRQRVEVRRGRELRANVSLNRQLMWSYGMGGAFMSSPALGDVNGDGCLDCVVGSNDKKVYALSGKDGAVLWGFETCGEVSSSPALGDLNGDGCLDCVVGSYDKKVYVVSGKDGAILWSYETGGRVLSSPALGDVSGDGRLDCVVGSGDGKVYALSGKDGAVLWGFETGGEVSSSPALGDVNGDGCLDCVVGSDDHQVYVISGRTTGPVLGGWEHARPSSAAALTRYGRMRHDGSWPTLAKTASGRAQTAVDPWVRSVTVLHLGLARMHLGDPRAALDAFAEARRLHLRAPDGAVFEWLASRRWAECPAERREEARKVLLDALAFQPDTVFDAFVEVRDLHTPEALADLRTLLDAAPSDADAQLARAMLLAAFSREGASADLFTAAERRVLAKLQAAEGSSARWHGYLALLADAEGDRDRFRRAHAAYLDQPRRPESLDALLAEIAAKK